MGMLEIAVNILDDIDKNHCLKEKSQDAVSSGRVKHPFVMTWLWYWFCNSWFYVDSNALEGVTPAHWRVTLLVVWSLHLEVRFKSLLYHF